MNQKKPGKAIFRAVGYLIVVILGMMAASVSIMFQLFSQERKKQTATEQEEEQKEQERRCGAADHIELAEKNIPEEADGLALWNITYYFYDDQGRRTAIREYDSAGELFKYKHYKYDEQGNRILEQSESPGLSWETYREVHFTYDEGKRLTLEQHYDGEVLSSEYFFRYMPDGSTYSVVQNYDEEGKKSTWFTTIFNENDNPVSEYHYDQEDQVQSCNLYRYDEEGRQIYYICYNKGDETTRPLREVFTEYGDEQTVRLSYEPLGHLNSAHYVTADENTRTEMYYLAGYSGGSGGDEIRILGSEGSNGQEEPKWNRELKFWEGNWQTYDGENMISSLHCSYDRIHSYCAYWYEEGNKVRELECSVDGGICITTMKRYIYNAEGTLAECYEYGLHLESLAAELQDGAPAYLEEELQDGTLVRLEFKDNVTLQRLLCTDAEGTVLREITFETEGRIDEWYEPLKEQMWAEALVPTENGIVPADRTAGEGKEEGENRTGQTTGEEQEGGLGQGESGGSAEFPCYYVVQRGDSLWKIAERVYGDPYQFVIIYRENREIIGPDWNFIPTGMLLLLPDPEI